MNINWALLRQQKAALVEVALSGRTSEYESEAFDGIINLLDTIQDETVSSGLADEETVFGEKTDE